jgi:sodium transport system permease protein
MNGQTIFTVYPRKRRDALRERRTLISILVLSILVVSVMFFSMGKIRSKVMTTAREEVPVVMVGLWPLYVVGPLHFMFAQ